MPIREFLKYFSGETKVTIKSMRMNGLGDKTYDSLFNAKKIKDITRVETYFESILSRTIAEGQVTIIDSVIIIVLDDTGL